jgi:hypothetical protein|eukprot:COSAG01_NODE_5018_length_4541_cov_2.682575_1_plen_211_part_00
MKRNCCGGARECVLTTWVCYQLSDGRIDSRTHLRHLPPKLLPVRALCRQPVVPIETGVSCVVPVYVTRLGVLIPWGQHSYISMAPPCASSRRGVDRKTREDVGTVDVVWFSRAGHTLSSGLSRWCFTAAPLPGSEYCRQVTRHTLNSPTLPWKTVRTTMHPLNARTVRNRRWTASHYLLLRVGSCCTTKLGVAEQWQQQAQQHIAARCGY